ncbi:OmpP1/FadL family transporter [Sulfuricurvum sp.]|uniref:OmpP1/FadL family transporter n=1 Tax=Sulfuricurvum sp. TaxID=2025608 RepID=UPI003C50B1D7
MQPYVTSIAVITALSTALYATNGDELIGLGAKTRGMGGAGIALSHGAESALINPALITSVKSSEVSFGGTVMIPSVETNGVESDADLSMAPAIAIASKAGDNLYLGVGMWGTAGMGVDYRGTNLNDNMTSNMQMMQFGLPIAYQMGSMSFGITPIIQYGALDISYDGSTTKGAAQDLALGYNVGAAYTVDTLTFGAVYKAPIEMNYKGQISRMMSDYGATATYSDNLERPEEFGFGVAYQADGHAVALDYKRINWSDAAGYRDFGWENQDVYAIGYQYTQNNWALRAGYNYAKSPISDQSGKTDGTVINELNLLAFPAIVESHYTVGGSYAFSKTMSVDASYVYAPEETMSFSGITTKHSQSNITAQLTINF